MSKFELIEGKCYEVWFSKHRKSKDGKRTIYPKKGKKVFRMIKEVDNCNCKSQLSV